jgi:hypothetical protein
LLNYRRTVNSQHGEDGIIEEIINTIPLEDERWCVEFGAWDGLHLTNTRNLIESRGFSAVLIEANRSRFAALQKNYSDNEKVTTINQFVGFDPSDGLDEILQKTRIPKNFTLLSIDIDGNDYHVWEAVRYYQPKVVIIGVDFIQPRNKNVNQGSSLSSLVKLARNKGYELVAALSINAFFVKKEFYSLFEIGANDPATLCTNSEYMTYLSVGYDGTIFLNGSRKLIWHGIDIKESDIQILPRYLRKFSGNYNFLQRCIFGLYRRMHKSR